MASLLAGGVVQQALGSIALRGHVPEPAERDRVHATATEMNEPPKRFYRFQFLQAYQRAVVAICGFNPQRRPVQFGTGFFVADGGVLATAAHLFTEVEGFTDLFALRPGGGDRTEVLQLGQPSVDHHHDVAAVRVCSDHVEVRDHPVLSIMSLEPELDEVVGAFGFPRTSICVDEEAGTQTITLNFTFATGRILDLVSEPVPLIQGGAYIGNFALDGGGSGAPVFNSNGFVTAIYSTGVDRSAENGGPSSSVVAVRHLFDLVLPDDQGHLDNVGDLIRGSAGWRGRRPNVYFFTARSVMRELRLDVQGVLDALADYGWTDDIELEQQGDFVFARRGRDAEPGYARTILATDARTAQKALHVFRVDNELPPALESAIAALSGRAIQLKADGTAEDAETRAIKQEIHDAARKARYELRHGWELDVSANPPRTYVIVAPSGERTHITDPDAWERI